MCDLYLSKVAVTPMGPRWAIDREALAGLPTLGAIVDECLILLQLTPIFPDQPNYLPHINSRDFLWIECKSSMEDAPSGWKSALMEAAMVSIETTTGIRSTTARTVMIRKGPDVHVSIPGWLWRKGDLTRSACEVPTPSP